MEKTHCLFKKINFYEWNQSNFNFQVSLQKYVTPVAICLKPRITTQIIPCKIYFFTLS